MEDQEKKPKKHYKHLNAKERRFVSEYVTNGGKPSEAAIKAGYAEITALKKNFFTKPAIKEAIEKKFVKIEEELEITFKDKIRELWQIVKTEADNAIRIKAISEINKMQGDLAPTKVDARNLNVSLTFTQLKELVQEYDREY